MELRQESLFADETKGGIEVIYSKFIDQRRMDYKALFGGFDHLRVITFSYGLGFVETVADMFEDVEIIIGSMNTVRPDIVDVAMHQKLEMKRLSKRKQLVERVKDGSVRIYFNMRKMSHEKLYILYADDGRCRIITGSANLSKRAFTGGQYEEITCFDGDAVMFDNRLARFESLKGMSSTTPLEPAAMVDFASVAGDSEGELEVVPVMRAKGVVYLCDMPEDDDEVETFYTFNPKDMTEEEREQYAAMREHKVDYKPVLLKGILSIKRKDYGRFVELALDAGMREALAGDYDEESQSGEFWFDAEKEGPRGILNWLGFSVEDETEDGIDFVFFEDSGIAAYRDDMGRAVFEACAPVIGAGSVLVFMENWDEAEEKDPRIWRYTFDGEKMHVQDGRFVFD